MINTRRLPTLDEFINEEKKKWSKDVDVKKGKMHDILNIPKDETIKSRYTSGEKLAKALIGKTSRSEAASMLAFAANIDPADNVLDAAVKWMGDNPEDKK